jgi:type IV fimbrial biogenesis protein FimT
MNRTGRRAIHPAARHTARRTARTPRQRGVTITESLICIAVLLIAIGTALPNFNSAREQRRIEGAAAQLETDLQLTRSIAVAQNRNVRFEVLRDTQGTCYIVHNGRAGECTCSAAGAVCARGVAVHRSQHYGIDAGVAIQANVASMVFDPLQGTVTPAATLRVEGERISIRQIVNVMGRIRSCSPEAKVPGYKAC